MKVIENVGYDERNWKACNHQKETRHDPTIQEVITFSVRVQVSYRVLSKISISNLERNYRRDSQAISILTVQAERTNRSARAECAARPCASGGIHTAKVFGIGIHGLSERKDGIAIVSTI